ncbi:MAG: hypothetical protein F6K47_13425, partial [Symploca sp. SIO2E6]|nr:hypothetical protein [Symploca sp. SIO2E6]
MTVEVANRRIETFAKRLDTPHLHLAYHAALPLALTPDLLYRLWATFQKDIQGKPLRIPWIAVSNLLLSGLCREIDDELYQMDAAVRSELLNRLRSDRQFGSERIEELSEFLLQYTEQQLRLDTNPDIKEFAQTQKLAALAYINPDEAAHKLATQYRDILSNISNFTSIKRAKLMQMAALVEASADSLKYERFESLRIYASSMASFARDDLENAANQLDPALDEKGQIRVNNVIFPIPEEIKAILEQIKARQPALQHPHPELTQEEDRDRRTLLSKVQAFWIEDILEQSLHNRTLIALELEERSQAVDDSQELAWDIPHQTRESLPPGTRVIDRLDALSPGRRLLILGKPGSGKTTTLLE